ncbi:cysteine desulfurase family protein [Flavobacterium sp.]|uniref:cysteine desulfurase family protein n=1 Tax=Flavobacterium sp. TaxID=239 RepID=UPI001212B2DE|nr:cysteine desulfurase family protein [Flavobacterium sp.]RZJ73024.1 MAG: cysteine desulfurase [Flavobacterium sp.]
MQKQIIYLDNNATTRTDDRVVETMLPFFTSEYANSGSAHLFGLSANDAVENAQENVASLIGCKPSEIVFTSGATEAINSVLKGLHPKQKNKIVTISTEHKAVLDTCDFLESRGFEVQKLAVNADGSIDSENFRKAVSSDTLLVCAMLVNNETGVIHPIKEMAKIARENQVLFLCDATQAVGKIPVDVRNLDVDFLAFSAHKFYGPKGIGALYTKSGTEKLTPLVHGGGQQRNRRSGTLNVPAIIGFGKACEIAFEEMRSDAQRIEQLRDFLESELLKIDGSFTNGNRKDRLYNTTNICFPKTESENMILALKNIAVSNGSACSAITTKPSHVLSAIGLSDENALASIRFSLGKFNTEAEIKIAVKEITKLVNRFRNQ